MNSIKKSIKLKALTLFAVLFMFATIVTPIFSTSAQVDQTAKPTISGRLNEVAEKGGYQTDPKIASSPRIIGIVVGAFIAFAGITFLVLMIIAGYGWMTANGNEEKVKKASSTIRTCIIGLIVSLSGYILWSFIFDKLIK